MTSTDLSLRPASPDDADRIARLYSEARVAAVPSMPPAVHTPEEDRAWLAGRLAGDAEGWVAERGPHLVGYLLLTRGWLDHLFVDPAETGAGVGTALLEVAKAVRPDGFGLWVFESNEGARRFYRRHGLVELERTDGSGNEEGSPDVRMVWPGRSPMDFLRGQMDEVDAELAAVVARRVALTSAIQGFKETPGHAGRDPARETEIAERMARLAPALDAEAWRRVMHEVISVSLDAAEADRS